MLSIPKTIKFIIADFDGIMTDNCVYIDEKLSFSRKINFKDIMAVSNLRKAGYELVFVSGENNPVIDLMVQKFKLKESYQDIRKKVDVVKTVVEKYNLKPEEFLYIGDDINDIDSLKYAKTRITVPNAVASVKQIEGIQITESCGGNGAFREVVDCLLNT